MLLVLQFHHELVLLIACGRLCRKISLLLQFYNLGRVECATLIHHEDSLTGHLLACCSINYEIERLALRLLIQFTPFLFLQIQRRSTRLLGSALGRFVIRLKLHSS